VTWRHDRAMTDNQVKTLLCHPGILARHQGQYRWPGQRALAVRAAHGLSLVGSWLTAARLPD
jgi:hypothetical protein